LTGNKARAFQLFLKLILLLNTKTQLYDASEVLKRIENNEASFADIVVADLERRA
jgi:hypothetical protein